jgi:phosphoribosylaminoimidazolecarboxamide formyltransferase / IMP cyclohydrolase
MSQIKTALISVYYKTGIEELARCLVSQGAEILSTGGTLGFLREKGIPVTSISDYTGQAEILGGRVKTLHPMIFGGILARRSNPEDMATLKESGIKPIDLVVVNLYPFEETIAKAGVTLEEAVEQIDIGGVSLIRAAAKNHADVYVCACPEDYQVVQDAIERAPGPEEALALRRQLAAKAFATTSAYDCAISGYLGAVGQSAVTAESTPAFPSTYEAKYEKLQDLRYGENPHQTAAFYRKPGTVETSVATARQLHGKELSYNNIIDLDSALEIVRAFEEPVCSIIKHNNPCGVARATTLLAAYKAARECDPVSAFGGVIGFNREVDAETATAVAEMFVEAVIAPGYSGEALAILGKKKNVRLLETGPFNAPQPQPMLKSVVGGLLVQTRDLGMVSRSELRVVSVKQPEPDDIEALLFAWRIAKFVKSNAIIYTSRDATIGIGAGQMSRIDSTNLAAVKAQSPVRGAYMASDAFFPFRDNVDRAADIGIKAIISPGGSVRDEEVIAAANEHNMIMVFTGMRHFRH